jgi:hypothetical protein
MWTAVALLPTSWTVEFTAAFVKASTLRPLRAPIGTCRLMCTSDYGVVDDNAVDIAVVVRFAPLTPGRQ